MLGATIRVLYKKVGRILVKKGEHDLSATQKLFGMKKPKQYRNKQCPKRCKVRYTYIGRDENIRNISNLEI